MIDQFLIFNPTGIVTFNYQPGKNLCKVTNAFIQDILISERKMKPVDGSEFNKTKNLNSTDSAAAAEEAEANEALITKENGNEEDEEDDEDDEDKDNEGGNDNNNEDEDLVVETDISLGTYSYEGYNLKYLIWSKEKTKVYFTMVYPSLITIKKPYEFLKNIKILYESSENDLNKFEKFFEIKLKDLVQDAPIYKGEEEKEEKEKEKEANNNYNITNISTSSINEKKEQKKKSLTEKKGRKWNADGSFYEEISSGKQLDFSSGDKNNDKNKNNGSSNLEQLVGNKSKFGTKTSDGEFIVSDLSEEMNKIFTTSKKKSIINSQNDKSNSAFGFLRNIIGGKKITKDDIKKIKNALSQHLIEKNVAPNVANSLISEIEKELVGSTTNSFTSIEETAKQSLSRQLVKLLTPNSSIDLLHEIQIKKSQNIPYVISVVGVNGVGKSTNLSKLAYWFLQNNYRVLITACDTFRSGAVEQLRTHVNNLVKLSPNKRQIELFESGYGGADLVAKIATGAIKYAKENKFDIVLMDTAGRRHNDSQLMAPLVSFAKAANPDKIIMVGEALVGTDSVLQAQNFNKAFGGNRHLDFFIVSKCDTVGDLIGSMVNMVYATGIPILFVGTGQTYTDLRTLSVDWAVNMLMS